MLPMHSHQLVSSFSSIRTFVMIMGYINIDVDVSSNIMVSLIPTLFLYNSIMHTITCSNIP